MANKHIEEIQDIKNKYQNKMQKKSINETSLPKKKYSKIKQKSKIAKTLKKKKFQTFCLYLKAKILPNNDYFKKYVSKY